jgi:hypothetical protein
MDTPVFDQFCDQLPDKVLAWDLRSRPVRPRSSDDSMLDPETAIVAGCEPGIFRAVVREMDNRDAAEEIAEVMHQRDLEQAAQPPVIEVTVTTPPEGIPRLELDRLVSETVRDITGPQPALAPGGEGKPPRRSKMLVATRRAQARRSEPEPPPCPKGTDWVLPSTEDDTPTVELPPYPGDGFETVEVHIP